MALEFRDHRVIGFVRFQTSGEKKAGQERVFFTLDRTLPSMLYGDRGRDKLFA